MCINSITFPKVNTVLRDSVFFFGCHRQQKDHSLFPKSRESQYVKQERGDSSCPGLTLHLLPAAKLPNEQRRSPDQHENVRPDTLAASTPTCLIFPLLNPTQSTRLKDEPHPNHDPHFPTSSSQSGCPDDVPGE